jgi:hypothetical protein
MYISVIYWAPFNGNDPFLFLTILTNNCECIERTVIKLLGREIVRIINYYHNKLHMYVIYSMLLLLFCNVAAAKMLLLLFCVVRFFNFPSFTKWVKFLQFEKKNAIMYIGRGGPSIYVAQIHGGAILLMSVRMYRRTLQSADNRISL